MHCGLRYFWEQMCTQPTKPLPPWHGQLFSVLPECYSRTEHGKPAHVAFYLDNLTYGGLQKQICLLIQQLTKYNYNFFCATHNYLPRPREDFVEQLAALKTPVHRVGDWLIPAFYQQMGESSAPYLSFIPQEIRSQVCSLAILLRRQRPDVFCYCRGFRASVLPVWAALIAGVPQIYVYSKTLSPLNAFTPTERFSWEREHECFLAHHPRVLWRANSHAAAHEFSTYLKIDQAKISVIPNGFDIHLSRPSPIECRTFRTSLNIPQAAPLVAGVFRLVHAKNIPQFARVLGKVYSQLPNLRIIHAGSGNADMLRFHLEEHGLLHCATLLGYCDNIPLLLSSANALLSTSIAEGLSNVWIESLYYGCPPISTNISDASKVIISGCGFVHDMNDEDSMADSLLQILKNNCLQNDMAEIGHTHICQKYSAELYGQRWNEEFSNQIENISFDVYDLKNDNPSQGEQFLRATTMALYMAPPQNLIQLLEKEEYSFSSYENANHILSIFFSGDIAIIHSDKETEESINAIFNTPENFIAPLEKIKLGVWYFCTLYDHITDFRNDLLRYIPRSLRQLLLACMGYIAESRPIALACLTNNYGIIALWAGILMHTPRLHLLLKDDVLPLWMAEHLPILASHPRVHLYCETEKMSIWAQRLSVPLEKLNSLFKATGETSLAITKKSIIERQPALPCHRVKQCNNISTQVTCIVRSIGERTTSACIHLLSQIFQPEKIVTLSAEPFTEALRQTMLTGLEEDRPWTLVIDADVLVYSPCLFELLEFANTQSAMTFMLHGVVFDKFFGIFRSAGNRLYKTKHMYEALKWIPYESESLRPEAELTQRMLRQGYHAFQRGTFIGLHDFEQDYLDILRKCILFLHKHVPFLKNLQSYWQDMAEKDLDFSAALDVLHSNKNTECICIDSKLVRYCQYSVLQKWKRNKKRHIDISIWNDQFVIQTLLCALNECRFTKNRPYIARTLSMQSYQHQGK